MKNILSEVETEITSLLKTESEALKKAKEDGDEASAPAESGPPTESASPEAPPEASAGPAEGSAPPGASPEASAPMSPEASAPAPEMGADPAAAQGPVDPEALKAEYSKLAPEELKAHYMACKAALFEMMGAAQGAGPAGAPAPGAPAPEASAPMPPPMSPPAPEASAPQPPPAFKAEVPASMTKNPANGSALKDQAPTVPDAIKKSEMDSKVDDLEKQVELMAKALGIAMDHLGTPIRKAVTSIAHIPRTVEEAPVVKEPSRLDVKNRMLKAMSTGKLSKSDKEKLISYSLGNIAFDQIKDLLEVK